MRRGFTLLELLTAVAIMAMLGVAASGGYSALVRGMRERSVVASVTSILHAAKERAMIDRVPAVVFCYNRCLRAAGGAEEESAVVCGEMVAVRRGGRLTGVDGRKLYDEFGDLDVSYESSDRESDLESGSGLRLFQFSGGKMSEMRYSVVSDIVYRNALRVDTFTRGRTNLTSAAYYVLRNGKGSPSWAVGDAYGIEFAELQLPDGFVFAGASVPTTAGDLSSPEVFFFSPDETSDDTSKQIDIDVMRPDASGRPVRFRSAGSATADDRGGKVR